MFTFAGRMKKTVILFLFSLLLTFVVGCTPSHYRLSFEEIDNMADYYPAQAKVYLERTDSNDNKGYYKLLACKIRYQITGVYFCAEIPTLRTPYRSLPKKTMSLCLRVHYIIRAP